MTLQLWELLLELDQPSGDRSLTCNQCFALIELLGSAIELGIDLQRLQPLARQHLDRCPGCREALLAQLERLEKLAQ